MALYDRPGILKGIYPFRRIRFISCIIIFLVISFLSVLSVRVFPQEEEAVQAQPDPASSSLREEGVKFTAEEEGSDVDVNYFNREFFHREGGRVISTDKIAWVDIAKVFSGYSATSEAKKELAGFISTAKQKLKEQKDIIAELEKGSAPDVEGLFKAYFEYEKLEKDIRDNVLYQQSRLNKEIMGKIYDVMQRIGSDRGYTIILDRSMVLYYQGLGNDITDEVIEALE